MWAGEGVKGISEDISSRLSIYSLSLRSLVHGEGDGGGPAQL